MGQLHGTLNELDSDYKELRIKTDKLHFSNARIVGQNVEELAIDLNKKTAVEREPLFAAQEEKLDLKDQLLQKQEASRF